MENEPTLTRIRKVRQRISEKYGHDPYKLVAHYIEFQKQYQDRLTPKPKPIVHQAT
jgi:hypothetical protein